VHCLVKPNSTFGEMVLPGDAQRPSMLRHRFRLRRRSEIAFFYENRSAWLKRWDALLRYGGMSAGMILLALLAFAILHLSAAAFSPRDFQETNLALFAVTLLVAAAVFCADRSTERTPLRAGPLQYEAGTLDQKRETGDGG